MEKCDCLNYCGDDPWLFDGRADWCDPVKQNVAKNQARHRDLSLTIDTLAKLKTPKNKTDHPQIDQAINLITAEKNKLVIQLPGQKPI